MTPAESFYKARFYREFGSIIMRIDVGLSAAMGAEQTLDERLKFALSLIHI